MNRRRSLQEIADYLEQHPEMHATGSSLALFYELGCSDRENAHLALEFDNALFMQQPLPSAAFQSYREGYDKQGYEVDYGLSRRDFSGKWVLPYGSEDYMLKLHRHVFPNGDYAYLPLPANEDQLRTFLEEVIENELEHYHLEIDESWEE